MPSSRITDFEDSSLAPTVASALPSNNAADPSTENEVQAARRGLLKAIWQNALLPRFSSRPIDLKTNSGNNIGGSAFSSNPIEMDGYFSKLASAGSFVRQSSFLTVGTQGTSGDGSMAGSKHSFQNSLRESYLTKSEQGYLHELLQSDDLDSIKKASVRLSDKQVFPTATDSDDELDLTEAKSSEGAKSKRNNIPLPPKKKSQRKRDSKVQEQLLEWHEKTTEMPSVVLQRVSSNQSAKKVPPLRTGIRKLSLNNSITQDDSCEISSIQPSRTADTLGDKVEKRASTDVVEEEKEYNSDLSELNSWIARTEGVDVDGMTSNPFKILGTSADDASCQPMVLSPPLMEGLQLFMPESLHEQHYWLKYSMVRDGPGLMKMLRHCRGSKHTILAIESTDGHVFGSFTSQPWRMTSPQKGTNHFYGSKDSFVWRMRQSRFKSCESVVEQLMMESKIDVFPFTGQNNYVQSCNTSGVALGYGEIEQDERINSATDDSEATTSHYGYAIKLNKSMDTGSTSSSETFGSPCLIARDSRGKKFQVANIELWTMTPHDTVEKADNAEMRALFLEENRHHDNKLNLIEILVGTHKS